MDVNISKEIGEIKSMVRDMYTIVVGNEHDKENGLLERVKELEAQIERHQNIINRITYTALGMGIPAGWGVVDIVQKIFAN